RELPCRTRCFRHASKITKARCSPAWPLAGRRPGQASGVRLPPAGEGPMARRCVARMGAVLCRDTVDAGDRHARYLVVANQTLQAAELWEELRKRLSAGPCSFFVIVRTATPRTTTRWPPAAPSPTPACGGGRHRMPAPLLTRRRPRRPGSGSA